MRKFAAEKSRTVLAHRKIFTSVLQHPTASLSNSSSSSHSIKSLPQPSAASLLRFLNTAASPNPSSSSSDSMASDYSSTPVKIDTINPKVIYSFIQSISELDMGLSQIYLIYGLTSISIVIVSCFEHGF